MADIVRLRHIQGLETHLRARIIAQDDVLPRVAAVFARGELQITDRTRPRGSFLFVGPTGTGKSETFACASAYVLGAGKMATFDMSEFQDSRGLGKLIGENRNDPGLLGQALLSHPGGALLFDEIEKANVRILDVFLQILWDGRVTVATGQTFALSEYYIGFTSNIGGAEAMRMERSSAAAIEHMIRARVQQSLRPELVARLDEILVFSRLGPDAQRQICGLMVERETARLRDLGFDLQISRGALEFLIREGFHPQLGARPLKRCVERYLQNAVVDDLFRSGIGKGRVELVESRLRIRRD